MVSNERIQRLVVGAVAQELACLFGGYPADFVNFAFVSAGMLPHGQLRGPVEHILGAPRDHIVGDRQRHAEGYSEGDFFAYLTNGGFNERFARILLAFRPGPVVIAGPVNHEHFKFFAVQAPDEGTCGNDWRCIFAGAGDGE